MSSLSDLIEVSRNREQIYAFLSKVYEVELTRELIEKLRSGDSLLVEPQGLEGPDSSDIRQGITLMNRGISSMKGKNIDEVWTELASDFAGTFLGIRYDILPHPSESAYANRDHLVYQKSRNEVMDFYRQAGLDKVSAFTEPEDHIAIELTFMSYLAKQTADALEANKTEEAKKLVELQKKFLGEHLAPWIPKLCGDILKAARLDFYKGLAQMTRGFISSDTPILDEMAEKLNKT